MLFIDFETPVTKNYTLKKLNYFEYLTDERFQVICLAAAFDAESEPQFVPGDEVDEFLSSLEPQDHIVAHNTLFDGLILKNKFGINPTGLWQDTLSMARAKRPNASSHSLDALAQEFNLGIKSRDGLVIGALAWEDLSPDQQATLRDYTVNDVKLLQALWTALQPFPEKELELIDLTLRMALEPRLQLDNALAVELFNETVLNKQRLLEATGLTKTQLSSNKQFAAWLEQQGIIVPKKISLTTGKETEALSKNDDGFKALMGKNSKVDLAIEARLAVKSTLEETRLRTLMDVQECMGSIPVTLRYYGGHTGRWSGLIFNLQNLPSKSRIRNTIIAPEGHVLLICDSASIEARVVLWLAGQENAVKAYKDGKDNYKVMASAIYGIPYENINKEQRTLGKISVLGSGYGMGAAKFQATCQAPPYNLTISEKQARDAINTYRDTFYQVPAFWKLCESFLPLMVKEALSTPKTTWFNNAPNPNRTYSPPYQPNPVLVFEEERIELPNGLALHYPDLRQTEMGEWLYAKKTKTYGGHLTENIVQALARIIIGEQMLRAHKEVGPVVLTVHDEIVCCVPEDQAESGLEKLIAIMRQPPDSMSTLPLDAEGKISRCYTK